MNDQIEKVLESVNQVILGKSKEIKEIMLTILAGGHILLVDIPGVGKTTLASAFARTLGLDYRRMSFTPDTMPSDLTGFSVYSRDTQSFHFNEGAIFTNLLLADEINRTSPKTQSALLEVMEEGTVSVEGVTRAVPQPFIVIATQNPLGSIGTNSLPEAQIDRFMVSLSLGYPDYESELRMLKNQDERSVSALHSYLDGAGLSAIREKVKDIFVDDKIYHYMLDLIRATRDNEYIQLGGSPRAAISLLALSRASAYLDGRDYVIPLDVREQFPYVIRHRIVLNNQARQAHLDRAEVINAVLHAVKEPALGR